MEYLYIHVPIYEYERFITTFCRGAGIKYYEYGNVRFFKNLSFYFFHTYLKTFIAANTVSRSRNSCCC